MLISGGVEGVFDIEELVKFLKKDKAQNIFVSTVPKELGYVDYFVVVTGRSQRHMAALATYIRKAYKLKHHVTDLIPRLEGKDSKDWMALDLGNFDIFICNTLILFPKLNQFYFKSHR